jgi:hypothetical protein
MAKLFDFAKSINLKKDLQWLDNFVKDLRRRRFDGKITTENIGPAHLLKCG